jgi:hypothetical protein
MSLPINNMQQNIEKKATKHVTEEIKQIWYRNEAKPRPVISCVPVEPFQKISMIPVYLNGSFSLQRW